MKTNRWIDSSRRIYGRLLSLYPRAHRDDYGQAMLQLFGDQCQSAYDRRGGFGLAALWFRTLFDLGVSAVSEHLSAPGAKWGLLDAIPNKPLPWKGVGLVLIPGLVLFASQVAQMTGENWWFFTVLLWMPYLLMAFVLLVWLITHKYPVWGLMPLGLLCSNLVYYGSRLVIAQFSYFNLPLFMWQFGLAMLNMVSALRTLNIQMVSQGVDVWLAVAFLLVSVFFIAAWQRRHSFSRAVWIWLAAYGLLSMVLVNLRVQNFVNSLQFGNGGLFPDSATIWGNVLAGEDFLLAKNMVRFWTLYSSGAFLVLIFAGILLARRYGDLAILFPLGYVLGGIVYGVSMEPDDRMLYLVVGVVLLYRLLVALVAPVWISRSSGRRRVWALAIPIGLAFIAQIALREIASIYYSGNADLATLLINLTMVVDSLVVAVGLALAISLYRYALPTISVQEQSSAPLTEVARE